ncbi:MAG: 2Fe-2S iron-sulfur cluster-binding protein [Candidatus Bathyarchaeota archaeon]|nr:2Fe-2S iron-sulfur cluster-binding protein [Candidatus Bathyarchaeum sp.]
MIISVRSLSYDELKRNLNHDDKIVIWSCDTCVKHCGIAGMEKMTALEDLLKEDGYTVLKKELVSESCQINLAKKHKAAHEDIFNESTAIILLTCEIGYQCVKTVFPKKKVIATAKTFGSGNFSNKKGPILTSPLPTTGLAPEPEGYTLTMLVEQFNLYPKFFDADKEPNPEKITITVDGKPVEVKKDANLLDELSANRIRIPHLCYDSSLGSIGACRMCLVKIEGKRGLVPSCCTQIEEGMIVTTEDEEITKLRKSILQMIIAECGDEIQQSRDIRYWMRRYKITENRFSLPKKDEIVDDSNEVLVKDPNRCILCGRCVRACANLSGQKVINFANRGSNTVTITGLNEPFASTDCAHCLACAHYCPTNAITPKSISKKISGYPFWTMITYPKKLARTT